MKLDGEFTFSCGCKATSGGPYWGYQCDEHHCDGSVLRAEAAARREQKFESARASRKRSLARLHLPQPFSILKREVR